MRSRFQKICLWFFIPLLTAVVCVIPYITIFGTNTARATSLSEIQNSVASQGIANAMSQCINNAYHIIEEAQKNGYDVNEYYNSPNGYNPFASVGSDYYVNTGYATGKDITGYLNSSVNCINTDPTNPSNSVIDKFAQSVGKTGYMDIICNGESAGIMKLQYKNGNTWTDAQGICRTPPSDGTEYRYVWNDKQAANSYLNSLYNGDWYSVGDFSDAQSYYRYYNEYLAVCVDPSNSKPVDVNAPNIDHSKYGSTIHWYDDSTGQMKDIHFIEKDNTKSWWVSGISSGLGGANSCGELAELINGYHETMDLLLSEQKKQADKDACVEQVRNSNLKELQDEARQVTQLSRYEDIPDDVLEKAKRVLRLEFWEEDGNGKIVCWTPDSIYGDGSNNTTTPPPTNNDNTATGPSTGGSNISGDSTPPSSGESDLSECFNNASSLGWILCPVLRFVGVAADGLWSEMSGNWLTVDANEYVADDSSTAYVAWTYFRNFANIAFAIFLLVIIISQLSGIGITNYGIKKLLPSLIVMAVLVNISFFICQVLIDVSNIVGASIGGILTEAQSAISPSSSTGAGDIVRGILGTLFSAVGIAGIGIAAAGAVLIQGPAIMIPLLIAALGAIISVVFVFLILAIRQACVLVMVIISPLAIICYALPNAKSLFDKWKKLFTALLFVYPVCSACIYGGQLVSSIMLRGGNTSFMYNLVGMLLQIVPLFFIPSLIRGSLSVAGNIGARVSQFGNNLRNRATGSLRQSEMVNRMRTASQGRAAQRNQGFFNRLSTHRGPIGAIGKYGARHSARNTLAYQKMQLEDQHAQHLLTGNPSHNIAAALAAQSRADEQKDVDSEMDSMIYDSSFDTTSMDNVASAFDSALSAYEANPDDYQAKVRARALAQFMMSKGDTGQSAMLEHLRAHVDPTGAGGMKGSDAMQSLAEYITNNDKWMGSIKSGDTGSFNFMNDLASGNSMKAANAYNAMGANKVTASTIGGMGDSWYRGMDKALKSGTMDKKVVKTFADMATKALTDPRTAHMIKGERLEVLNKMRQVAYENEMNDWMSANAGKTQSDYEKQFGAFQNIERPGDELKVIHTKATVPTGWTESGVWIGGGSGPTRQQQVAYDEWAKHSAEVDRHNSQV